MILVSDELLQKIKDLYHDMCIEFQDDCPSDYRAKMQEIYNRIMKGKKMSSILKWSPKISSQGSLSDELKFVLTKSFCTSNELASGITLNKSHINYFQGLTDAGIKDAGEVIELLNKYEGIVLKLEF